MIENAVLLISNFIMCLSTISMAVATIVYARLTSNLLTQQKKEEEFKYAPYLNIEEFKIEKNDSEEANINIKIKNNGITPAYKLEVNFEIFIEGRSVYNSNGITKGRYSLAMPNSIKTFSGHFDPKILDEIKESSEKNYIILRFMYHNYNKDIVKINSTYLAYYLKGQLKLIVKKQNFKTVKK